MGHGFDGVSLRTDEVATFLGQPAHQRCRLGITQPDRTHHEPDGTLSHCGFWLPDIIPAAHEVGGCRAHRHAFEARPRATASQAVEMIVVPALGRIEQGARGLVNHTVKPLQVT